MKAYKCDLCKQYCDNVLTIHGVSEPYTHVPYKNQFCDDRLSMDCCEKCYDEVMLKIEELMK
jgi:hypothetical protein